MEWTKRNLGSQTIWQLSLPVEAIESVATDGSLGKVCEVLRRAYSCSANSWLYHSKHPAAAVIVLSLLLTALNGQAQGQTTLTFDDLPQPLFGFGPIPDGYRGLQWEGFSYLDGSHFFTEPSGYSNAVVSAHNVAYGGWTEPSVLSGAVFDLNSGYFTGAWNDDLQMRVQGFLGGTSIYDNVYTLVATGTTFVNFGYVTVDQVVFTSSGGTYHWQFGFHGGGEMFALDNLNVSVVPEPSSVALMGISLLALFYRSRHFKKSDP